jgi:integrase
MVQRSTALAPLKPVSRTIDGFEFDPSAPTWRIGTPDSTVPFNFETLPAVSDEFRDNARAAFAALLLANAPERMSRGLTRIRALLKFLSKSAPSRVIGEITASDLLNYGASLPGHQQYFLRLVRAILISWARTGVGGLSADLVILLPSLETKHHDIGAAVRTMDPEEGPLTDLEFEAVLAALRGGYSTGEIDLSDYALVNLAISLGCRALQLAMIKIKDLSVSARAGGDKIYILQVTRLKQGKNIRPRTLFKARELAPSLGGLLEQQAEIAGHWAEYNELSRADAPLFPSTTRLLRKDRTVRPGLDGHHNSGTMGTRLTAILSRLSIVSPRTGKPLTLFQTRMRRTFGTRAAAEGLPAPVIAELMDHSWVDSSLVYIETRPEMIERIDKALALKIAPLAQAFSGTLSSRHSSQPTKRVIHIDTEDRLESVGGCGKFEFCGLAAPLACYTCTYFNPWLDGIHEALLDRLLAEREEMLSVSGLRMASINDGLFWRSRRSSANAGILPRERGREQSHSPCSTGKGRR